LFHDLACEALDLDLRRMPRDNRSAATQGWIEHLIKGILESVAPVPIIECRVLFARSLASSCHEDDQLMDVIHTDWAARF
jgi:hypothetical protein